MDKPVLKDEAVYPDDKVLTQHLGRAKSAYDGLMEMIAKKHPDYTVEWRYYQDGKAWLCKIVKKKKTICWLSVWDGFFKTGCYFSVKHDIALKRHCKTKSLKKIYMANKMVGKSRAMEIDVKFKKQLPDIETLFLFKESVK